MAKFQLRFTSLYEQGKGYTFPCNNEGQPVVAEMSNKEIRSYNEVKELVGIEVSYPTKEPK